MRLPLLLASLSIMVPLAAAASAGELVNPIAKSKCAEVYTFAAGATPCIASPRPGTSMFPRLPTDPTSGIVPPGLHMPPMGTAMPGSPASRGCNGPNLCAYTKKPAGIP